MRIFIVFAKTVHQSVQNSLASHHYPLHVCSDCSLTPGRAHSEQSVLSIATNSKTGFPSL